MKKHLLSLLFLLFTFSGVAQDSTNAELDWWIVELDHFHEIMYPMWHNAYPAKDYEALKSFLPEVITKAEKIYAVKLSGVVQDKQAEWDKNVDIFRKTVDQYSAAVKEGNNDNLLKAVEDMHTRYEGLVRTLRPLTKESDAFHQVLYMIFHYYLPEKNYEKLAEASHLLHEKAVALDQSVLPDRLKPREAEFKAITAELVKTSAELKAVCDAKNWDGVSNAVNTVHDHYAELEEKF